MILTIIATVIVITWLATLMFWRHRFFQVYGHKGQKNHFSRQELMNFCNLFHRQANRLQKGSGMNIFIYRRAYYILSKIEAQTRADNKSLNRPTAK